MARVLVIDDDQMLSRLLGEHLSNEGFEVDSASMAEDGLEKAFRIPPDLIILDVQLPDATGFQTCGKFRENPLTRNTPIIMMTGTARSLSQQAIAKNVLGATDYILKPFNVIEVGEKVHAILGTTAPARRPAEVESQIEKSHRPVFSLNQNTDSKPFFLNMVTPPPVTAPAPTLNFSEKPERTFRVSPSSQSVAASAPAPVAEPTPYVELSNREIQRAEEPFIEDTPSQEWKVDLESAPPAEEPPVIAQKPIRLPRVSWKLPAFPRLSLPSKFISGLFILHLTTAGMYASFSSSGISFIRAASYVASGWILFFGLLTGITSLFRVSVGPRRAMAMMGLAGSPIVLRSFCALAGILVPSWKAMHALTVVALPGEAIWIRPLDVFETTALLILGISLRQHKHLSLKKTFAITAAIALFWAFAGHGYFLPF